MRHAALSFAFALLGLFPVDLRGADAPADGKLALQALNDFIGEWKANGGPDRPRPDPKESWSETISWSWRFKAPTPGCSSTSRAGSISAVASFATWRKRRYQFNMIDAKQQKLVFEGSDTKGYLTFERTDPATSETQQLVMNSAGDGVRFVYRYAVRPKGRTGVHQGVSGRRIEDG